MKPTNAEGSCELLRRDIASQPAALSGCLDDLRAQAEDVAEVLRGASRVTLTGSGDSYLAGLALRQFSAARSDRWRVMTPEDAVEHVDHRPGDVVVPISFSGSGRRTLDAVRVARAAGARTLSLTADPGSALAGACDDVVVLPWRAASRSIPHAADFTVTALAIAVLLETIGDPLPALDDLSSAVGRTIELQAAHRSGVVDDLRDVERSYVLGAGDALGVAAYGVAKLWEAGGYPAWASDVEEFGHGLHLTARPGDIAFVLTGQRSPEATEDLIAGLRSLGLRAWTVGPRRTSDQHLLTVVADPTLAVFSDIVPLQYVCLWLAELRGADVESPPDAPLDSSPYRQYRGVVAGSSHVQDRVDVTRSA